MKYKKLIFLFVCPFLLCGCFNEPSSPTKEDNKPVEVKLTMDNFLYYLSMTTTTNTSTYSSVTTTHFEGSSHYIYHNCILYYASTNADTSDPNFVYSKIELSISGVGEFVSRTYVNTSGISRTSTYEIKKVSGTVERVI